ncbi:hypothetical protein ACFL5Z_04985 [Planctomycetota bacterium]
MCRKLSDLGCLILLLAFANNASAACNWEGATSSNWFDASNWAPDYPEESPGLPINIRQAGNFDPVVDRTTTGGQRVDISSNGHLTINSGGNVQSNNWYFQGREGGGAPGDSLLTINEGGKLTAGLDNPAAEARVGYHQPGMHVLQMNGGEFSIPNTLTLSVDVGAKGHIQLDGGMMSVGGLIIGAEGTIDFNGGTMVINGDVTTEITEYVSQGKITGKNGTVADVRVEYDVPYPGKTTITAPGTVRTTAFNPVPADGDLLEETWANLSWSPGDFAVSHDVYIGDSFDDVDNGAEGTFAGNQTATLIVVGFPGFPYPEGLVPGTTYYWRIDEVNEAEPNSPWKGDIWRFSIPPKTAYNPDPTDGTGIADTTVTLTWTPGIGAKLHTMYFGDDFDTVANATVGIPAGTVSYDPGQLESEKVYYWRVDEFDGIGTYKGDVWTFTTPGAVGSPQPANGAADVSMATVLSWTAADNAASHEVYLGLDKDSVRSADAASPEYKGSKALGAESYDTGLLEPDTTFYWRVDEVYNGNPVKGPVWNFTVGDYLLVEDFESYTDDDPNNEAIWQHWIDGFGVADNGAHAGNLLPPYCEQTIVHGGSQSMPLFYVNEAGVSNSEATLTLTSMRDWTMAGVDELSVWTRGSSSNATDPLYVAISNTAGLPAIVAHDNPSAATASIWSQWQIPLQAFADQGINLSNVDKIAIGLGSKSGLAAAGGSGTIYVDDIRLYQP